MSPVDVKEKPKLKTVGGTAGAKGLKGIVAGGITGGLEICITYPTEYIKTQLQLDEKGDRKKYKGIIDCAVKTVRTNGIFGLYRGLSVLLLGSIPKSATRFGGYEFISSFLKREDGTLNGPRQFLSGLGAGAIEAIAAVTPMETIKVKFISDQRSASPKFKGLLHGVKQIIKAEGISGIYQGLAATVLKQASNQAVRFTVMGILKNWYTNNDPSKTTPKPVVGFFGIISGAASVFANNPVDVVKTRMQGFEASKYRNSFDCAYKVLKHEGPMAFYKGTIPRLSRVCLDVAITFMLYDFLMETINLVWK